MTPVFKIVIPSRYASTRFPAKALAEINGKAMVQHVYERALESNAEQVIIATDDARIQKVAEGFNAEVCLTSTQHVSGSDRLAEVASIYNWPDDTIVVNVQGDEPLIPPENIRQVAANLDQRQEAAMATLTTPFVSDEELSSVNNVKVVCDKEGYALYFSRAVIPFNRDTDISIEYQRHVGIYAYRAGYLRKFAKLEPAPVEIQEKLEQLRALWYGWKIHVATAVVKPPPGVDTPDDLERLLSLLNF